MITGAIALFRGGWELAGKAMKGLGEWLRRPRNWWRFIAITLGVVCLGSAFAVRDARQQVVIVREACNTQVAEIKGEVQQAKAAATTAATTAAANERALRICRTQLAEEVGKQQDVDRWAREAVEAARRDAAKAKSDLAEWQRSYRNRPATCKAALEALEEQCPSITDY